MTDYAAVVQKGIDEILRLRTINADLWVVLEKLNECSMDHIASAIVEQALKNRSQEKQSAK